MKRRGERARGVPRRLEARTAFLWAVANSLAGLGVGAAIRLFAEGDTSTQALIPMSIVFANVVGFGAVLTVRYLIPRYSELPGYVRLPLAVVTLIGAGVFGSGVAILLNPLIVFYQIRYAFMVVTLNAVLAVVVGLVTYTYDRMRTQIEDEAAERGQLEREMAIARSIQTQLLPKAFPRLPGVDIFGFSVPARHVGGDCYDVVDIGDGRMAFTIGDVSGKGTPAALLMANVQATVRALTDTCGSPRELVARVNRLVCGFTDDGVFVTFFYGVLDYRTGELRYVNAGHNPPCVLRADGRKEYLTEGGLVIGLIPGAEYEEGHALLASGDNLVLYTDGVTEATNPEDEMFGVARLEELLVEHRHATAREIEERVYTHIKDFAAGAPQADDLTMVVVKVDGVAPGLTSINRSGSPREAKGGPPAARGTPAMGDLWGPAAAAPWTDLCPGAQTSSTQAHKETGPPSWDGPVPFPARAHLRRRSF